MEEPPPEIGRATRSSAGAHHFGALGEALLRYVEARGVLLSVEGQEAVQHVLGVMLRGVLAAIFGFTGWLLLMVGVVSCLTVRTGWSWGQVTVAVGLGNLILAMLLAYAALRRVHATRWFEHTLSEFRKDRAWLGQLNDGH